MPEIFYTNDPGLVWKDPLIFSPGSPIFMSDDTDSIGYSYTYLTSPYTKDTIISSKSGVPLAQLTSPTVTPVISINTPYSPSSPLLSTEYKKTNSDPEGKSLYIPTVKYTWPNKASYGVYENLNADPHIRKRIVKYVRFKLLDEWLYGDLKSLLKYVKKTGKSKSTNIQDKKVDYLEENVVTESFVKKIVEKYVKETQTNWFDIPKNDYFMKQIMKKELKKALKK